MPFSMTPILRRFGIPYTPRPDERPFLERVQVERKDNVEVKVAVLGSRESDRFFGVPLSRRGIQPVWIEVKNERDHPIFFDRVRLDPNYYPPLEAAMVCHFALGKRLAGYGLLAWVFLPLLVFLPLKLYGARRANRRMDEYFCSHSFPLGLTGPGETVSGFVFASLDDGMKIVNVHFFGPTKTYQFVFSVPVPGIAVDYDRHPFIDIHPPESLIDCDERTLHDRLEKEPRATTNSRATREGDPANLVVVGDFPALIASFGARWDETETISLASSWKTVKAFLIGARYRYSPVSPLYLYGRSQDFALQRARQTINERLHLRLWLTPLLHEGKSVWVGQISRDIGVRFTPRTWNLTTHRIDPAVDEARDYIVADLLESGHLDRMSYVGGVGISGAREPRRNLTGDPYLTDGNRAVVILSPTKTTPRFLGWNLHRPTANTPVKE